MKDFLIWGHKGLQRVIKCGANDFPSFGPRWWVPLLENLESVCLSFSLCLSNPSEGIRAAFVSLIVLYMTCKVSGEIVLVLKEPSILGCPRGKTFASSGARRASDTRWISINTLHSAHWGCWTKCPQGQLWEITCPMRHDWGSNCTKNGYPIWLQRKRSRGGLCKLEKGSRKKRHQVGTLWPSRSSITGGLDWK